MGKDYGILVPQVDADGLDIAGIRSVDVQAPIGTSLDFNYNANLAWNDLSVSLVATFHSLRPAPHVLWQATHGCPLRNATGPRKGMWLR